MKKSIDSLIKFTSQFPIIQDNHKIENPGKLKIPFKKKDTKNYKETGNQISLG